MGFQIDNPIFLLLFIPVLGVLYLFWRTTAFHSKIEKGTILVVRFFIFSLIILALCSPFLNFTQNGVTTVFVVDHSESVRNENNAMYESIEVALEGMEEHDMYAIITVAEEAHISQSVSTRDNSIVSTTLPSNTSFTNLEEGLQVASSILKTNGRIVLLTDGNENIGNVKDQVHVLKEQGIEIDVIPFTTSISKDVALEEFHVPKNLFNGELTTIQTTISSTVDTSSRIRISKNNEVVVDEVVVVKQGTNVYSFDYVVDSPGIHSFQAEISSEADSLPQNNVGYAISNVQGTPTVLIVEGSEGEASNITPVLEASGIQVERMNPITLPTSLTGLLEYESIIFSNVSATDVTQEQMELIESAVRDFGVGFIMTGGNKSYGLGGYFKTPIETILPVEMDLKGKKELPSLGLIIVLDRSGSMAGYKMDLAKEAAARSIELLREKDTLGFIAFDDQPWQIIETEPLHDKEEAANKIRALTEGGGTNIFPALQLAYEQLEPLDVKRKHIILLTDGHSATNYDYYSMIEEGLEANITLSTVAIGNDADRLLLEELATEGTGRYYDVQDASTIPSILSRETILTTRTYIEDNPFYPTYLEGTDWNQIFNAGVPQMNVYVATDPKSRAEEILISDKGDPVLVRWQYGLGNTIAWTSDVRGEWAGDWPLWDKWPELWNEMLSWSLPSYQQEMYYIQQMMNGKEITLHVSSENLDILPLQARIVDDKGNEIDAQIRPTAPGEHEVTFQADTGIYFLQLSKIEDNQVTSTYQTGIVVPYSKEFELTEQNNSLLKEITDLSGGMLIENPEDVFRELEHYPAERQPIFSQLLLLAFLLLFIEISIRRFGLISILEKVKRKQGHISKKQAMREQEVEQTFSRLKKATSSEKRTPISKESASMVKQEEQKKEPKREKKKEKQVEQSQQESVEDRMKRLLEAKNRKNK